MKTVRFAARLVVAGNIELDDGSTVEGLLFGVDEAAAIRAAVHHGYARRMVVVLHIEEPGEQLDLPLLGATNDGQFPDLSVFKSDGTECTARRSA